MGSILFYDVLIRQALARPGAALISGVDYVESWQDHAYMTIALLTFHWEGESGFLVLDEEISSQEEIVESISLFQKVVRRAETIVGFNSIALADEVCGCGWVDIKTTYDLHDEIKRKANKQYSFNEIARANGMPPLMGNDRSLEWQIGDRSAVIAACVTKINNLKALFDLGQARELIDPHTGGKLRLNPLPFAAAMVDTAAAIAEMDSRAFLKDLRLGSFVWIRRDEGDRFRDSIAVVSQIDDYRIFLHQNVMTGGRTETVIRFAKRSNGVVGIRQDQSDGGYLVSCQDPNIRANAGDRVISKAPVEQL